MRSRPGKNEGGRNMTKIIAKLSTVGIKLGVGWGAVRGVERW